MAPVRTPRASWIDAGLRALADGGPDAIRVEVLARSLGVTKGGFYWHFADRAAFLSELLDAWERTAVDDAIARVDAGGGSPRQRLRRLFALADADDALLQRELAVRDWARRDPAVAVRLERVDDRRMDFMRPLFASFCADDEEVEARGLLVLSLFIGSPFVAASHGDHTRADVLAATVRILLG